MQLSAILHLHNFPTIQEPTAPNAIPLVPHAQGHLLTPAPAVLTISRLTQRLALVLRLRLIRLLLWLLSITAMGFRWRPLGGLEGLELSAIADKLLYFRFREAIFCIVLTLWGFTGRSES